MVPIAALNALRRLLGNAGASFRSQEQAMTTAMLLDQTKPRAGHAREDPLVILPTGTGKTLTWMVAQSLASPDSLTIVIVPLHALLMDLSARLKAHGQRVHICAGDCIGLGLEGRSGFILTSVERAVQPSAVREIHAMEHKINRIMFDEAHLSHTAKSYRDVMRLVGELMKTRPPTVLMTGTCGPSMEAPMLKNLGLDGVKTIRSLTDRPEIMYSIHPALPIGEHLLAFEIERWYDATLRDRLRSSSSQVLIYVRNKVIGRQIAERLGIDFFESGTSPEEKRRMYESFKTGNTQCLVATQAFGAGIDVGSVDVVVHAGSPGSMVDFAQESGRAGRGGQPAMSIVFRSIEYSRKDEVDEGCGREEIRAWLTQSTECRRLGLGRYLDGRGRSCPMIPNVQLCDVCRTNGATETTVIEDLWKQLETRPVVDTGSPLSGTTERVTSSASSQRTTTGMGSGCWSSESSLLKSPRMSSPYQGFRARPLVKASSSTLTASSTRSKIGSAERPSMKEPASTPTIGDSVKRKWSESAPSLLSANKRRFVTRTVQTLGREEISLDGPMVETTARVRRQERNTVFYTDLLQPILRLFIRKKGVCFSCVGRGAIDRCSYGHCQVERALMEREQESNMMVIINRLTDHIKLDMRALGYCQRCFLPAPRDETTNVFHPQGMGSDASCIIFPTVATKALSSGCRLWQQRLEESPVTIMETDPLWLKDLLENGRAVDEPTIEAFARILKTPCGSGEHWFLRIFYFMIKEAVERDERR